MAWGIATAAFAAADFIGGVMGASAAKDAAKDAAKTEKKITKERLVRLEDEQARDLSQLDVLQYAGGFAGDSVTNQIYKREFEQLQREEVDWLKLVGQSRYDSAKATQKGYNYEIFSKAASGGANLASALADLGKTKTGATG